MVVPAAYVKIVFFFLIWYYNYIKVELIVFEFLNKLSYVKIEKDSFEFFLK